MAGPYDFSLGDVTDPSAALLRGINVGNGLQQMQMARQQQALAFQQQQQAMEQQRQQSEVIRGLISKQNPTAQDYANASLLLPTAMREQVQQAWKLRNEDQQQSSLQDTGKVFAALSNGQPAVAAGLLRDRAGMLRQIDPNQAQALETMAGVADVHPEFARALVGMHLSSLPGGDKVVQNLAGLGAENRATDKAPIELREAKAKAETAGYDAAIKGVQAGNAPTATVLENSTKAEAIKTAQLKRDIDRLDVQISAANSETKLGELRLQRDKLVAELDLKQQDRAKGAQSDMDAATNALATVDSVLKHPGMSGFFGPGSVAGKMAGMVPGTDSKDFRSLVDTLKSQAFLTQIEKMRGMGQLTELEGKKITDAVANLDTDQSQGQLKAQLGVVRNSLQKVQSRLTATNAAPTSGPGAYVMRHPQYGNVTEPMVNDIMRRMPGATREQVMQFLQSTGGK